MDLFYILVPVIMIGFIVLFVLLPRYGPHYTSRLTCPNCRKQFNFHWIPGATITSIVNRSNRRLKCPYCKVKSTYNIMNTRYKTPKKVNQKP